MTTKIRTTLITGLFFFAMLTGLQAQEKYEYAIISYYLNGLKIVVSINGTEFKKIEVPKAESKDYFDTNPVLTEVSKMNNEGWEVFDTGSIGANNVLFFYLRKKK